EVDWFVEKTGVARILQDDGKIVDVSRQARARHEARRARSINEQLKAMRDVTGDEKALAPFPEKVEGWKADGKLMDGGKLGWKKVPSVNFRESVAWVGEYGCRSDVRPEDAPNGLTAGLLRWFRQGNDTMFYREFVTRLIPTSAQLQD